MNSPLVSVICLSYNHAPYVMESIESILSQDYHPVEIIVVDDYSKDNSREIITRVTEVNTSIRTFFPGKNLGNCRAFNTGFRESSGKYIIDLAADDVLKPGRIRQGVECLENAGDTFGVHFTDAEYIDEKSVFLRYHYKRNNHGKLVEMVPQGNIYRDLLERYFICAPAMMMRRTVLEELDGYDENLAYEDFDFWVRSSRNYKYCFTEKPLVKKRILPGSLSSRQYVPDSSILASTYKVCLKAEKLNRNRQEHLALARRAAYEGRQALISGNFALALKFLLLIERLPFD